MWCTVIEDASQADLKKQQQEHTLRNQRTERCMEIDNGDRMQLTHSPWKAQQQQSGFQWTALQHSNMANSACSAFRIHKHPVRLLKINKCYNVIKCTVACFIYPLMIAWRKYAYQHRRGIGTKVKIGMDGKSHLFSSPWIVIWRHSICRSSCCR